MEVFLTIFNIINNLSYETKLVFIVFFIMLILYILHVVYQDKKSKFQRLILRNEPLDKQQISRIERALDELFSDKDYYSSPCFDPLRILFTDSFKNKDLSTMTQSEYYAFCDKYNSLLSECEKNFETFKQQEKLRNIEKNILSKSKLNK